MAARNSLASRRLCVALIGCALLATLVVEARQRPSFRVGVELVTLSVTVAGAGGLPIGNLDAEDFIILEDGRPQELTFFSRANTALSVSLLIDSSASMEAQMALTQKAATDFVAHLRPGDIAEIVDFDSRVQVVQPFTTDRAALGAAIQRITPGGSTSLYNAVYITLRRFEQLRVPDRDEIRREVIVVLSDGEDTSSLIAFDEVLDLAKRSQTAIYTIGLGLEARTARPTLASGEFSLRRIAQDTGGRLFTPKDASGLADVYADIADELTNQYVLGYLSSNAQRDGRWRQVTVRARRPNLQTRTRTGYFASASSGSQDLR